MRAAHVDLYVETSTTYSKAFQFVRPDPAPTPVEDLVVGDVVFYERAPWRVDSVTVVGDRVTLGLGTGRYFDPLVQTTVGRTAHRALPVTPTAALARWAAPESTDTPAPTVVDLPTRIVSSTVLVELSPLLSDELAELIDFDGWGPSGFVVPWDLQLTLDTGEIMRPVEGHMTVVRSTTTTEGVRP